MKKGAIFIIFVFAVLGILFSISGKKFPRIPDDSNHISVTIPADCMKCHGTDAEHYKKSSHPPKFECFKCHKTKKRR
jgi:hypothetical protein